MPNNKTPTIDISEFKRDPKKYLSGEALAVTAEGQVIGYAIGELEYKILLDIVRQCGQTETFEGQFNPSSERLRQIAKESQSRLESYDPKT